MSESLLILFVRNPVRGKVKTRLAATVGADKALEIYQVLLNQTLAVTRPLEMDKEVFFSDAVDLAGPWAQAGYTGQLQQGGDLGERMAQALAAGFAKGYRRVGIMGSDCYELSTEILQQAFALLAEKDLVLGPAADGGYYFLGLGRFEASLFQNKSWSTPALLQQTLDEARKLHLEVALLPELRDVDEEKDLVTIPAYRSA